MADPTTKVTKSTQIVHASGGATVIAGGMSGSADVSAAPLVGTGNLNSYPRCDVVLSIVTTAAITTISNQVLLYRRDKNIDTGINEIPPNTSNKQHFVGSFTIPASTTAGATHNVQLTDIPLPGAGDCEFYIENVTPSAFSTGWTLKVTPKSDVGATS